MSSNHVDLSAAVAYVAGGGLAALTVALSSAFPTHAVQITAYSSIAVTLAGLLLRVYFNRSVPAGTQPVITSTDVQTPRVKDLTTPSAVAESEKSA